MKNELLTFHAIANGLKNPRNMAIKSANNSQVATIHSVCQMLLLLVVCSRNEKYFWMALKAAVCP